MWTNHFEDDEKGYQVILSVYNGEKYLERCFRSLEETLKDKKWILMYGDDQSSDDSIVEMAKYAHYRSSAEKVHFFEYDKAKNVAVAKNRLLKEAHKYKEEYPAILMMDADDEMLPERANMLNTAISQRSSFIVGAWEKIENAHKPSLRHSKNSTKHITYGPWATLFDCNALPEDGLLFPEDDVSNCGYEDLLAWYHLKYIKNINPIPHLSSAPVHKYYKHSGSVSHPSDIKTLNYNRNTFWGIAGLIKDHSRNIYDDPPSREEADEAMNKYIEKKEAKPSDDAEHPLG